MLTHDRSKRKAASLCHESLRYILYIIWGSLANLKIAFFWHQRYTKLHHSKVWNIQTREMNTAFSSHNVTGFKGYLPRSPSSYPVRVVWNDNEAGIIYMLSTRGAKRGSNYIYFRFQSLSLPLSMVQHKLYFPSEILSQMLRYTKDNYLHNCMSLNICTTFISTKMVMVAIIKKNRWLNWNNW